MIIQGCALNERNKLVLINFADELDALILLFFQKALKIFMTIMP